ncbi:MAG: ABC transporter permease [Cyclobacteriaceae bacterium]|nr:ABC transporter permease [Cyclobacteriaceae bacterium]
MSTWPSRHYQYHILRATGDEDLISFNPFFISFALIKSFVFAFLISSISSFKGYFTQGGALEVGIASTEAVTTSIIAVLSADYFLAYLLL